MGILKQINDYKVPIPLYWLSQGKSTFTTNSDLGITILDKEFEYDPELGILNKERNSLLID
jgi:CRISPR-associated endonuclease/helicase Cas3